MRTTHSSLPEPVGRPRSTGSAYAELFRLPHVAALIAASLLARLAGRMFILAIILSALERFHSPSFAGLISFIAMAPGLAISPLAGALIERVGAERAIAIDLIAGMVLLTAMGIAGLAGALKAPPLLALVAAASLTNPLGFAGIRNLLPRLVPEPALDRANAVDTATFALAEIVGPLLAGSCTAAAGADLTMLLIALLYAVAAACLLPLVRGARAVPGHASGPLLSEALAGVTYLVRHPTLRALALAYALYQVGWGILLIAVPVVVVRAIGEAGPAESLIGTLWTICGTMAALGALAAGRLRTIDRERQVIAGGIALTGAALAALLAPAGLASLAVVLTLAGLLEGAIDVGVLTLRQRRTDPGRLGRVLAVSISINMAGLPLGSALGGVLLAGSPALACAAASAACLASALAAWRLIPR